MKLNLLKTAQLDMSSQLSSLLDRETYLACRAIQTRHVQASLARTRASIRAYQFLCSHVASNKKQSFIQSLAAWVKKDLCY